MTTQQKWVLALAIAAIAIWYFWGDISKLWNKTPKEGDACIDSNGATSVIENGLCKEVSIPGPNGNGGGAGNGSGDNTSASRSSVPDWSNVKPYFQDKERVCYQLSAGVGGPGKIIINGSTYYGVKNITGQQGVFCYAKR